MRINCTFIQTKLCDVLKLQNVKEFQKNSLQQQLQAAQPQTAETQGVNYQLQKLHESIKARKQILQHKRAVWCFI